MILLDSQGSEPNATTLSDEKAVRDLNSALLRYSNQCNAVHGRPEAIEALTSELRDILHIHHT